MTKTIEGPFPLAEYEARKAAAFAAGWKFKECHEGAHAGTAWKRLRLGKGMCTTLELRFGKRAPKLW